MKKVFSSNSQLAHVWANQLQEEGRGSSMFFYGPVIYSYGYHYEIARFLTPNHGRSICFVNSNGYSNSTAKHTNHVYNAIPDGIHVFKVPFLNNKISLETLPTTLEIMRKKANSLLEQQMKAKSCFTYFLDARQIIEDANEIAAAFDLPTITIFDIPKYYPLFDAAEEKYNVLRATESKRQEEKAAKQLEKSLELLNKWLNHEYNGTIYDIPVHLRVSKDGQLIQTTKGASVPISEGLALLRRLRLNDDVKGSKIGGFTVIGSDLNAVKIGCHTIPWQSINSVFPG
jgi:hypothetical protein